MKMHKILVLIAVICVSGGYIYWDSVREPTQIKEALQEHEQAIKVPDFEYTDINGNQSSLYAHEEKVILLNFWATWCAPCVKEFPDMVALSEKFEDQLVFIAMSVDENPDNIGRFLKRLPKETQSSLKHLGNVYIAHDQDKAIAQDLFQTIKYPETYVIRKDLKVEEKVVGEIDWLSTKIVNRIKSLK